MTCTVHFFSEQSTELIDICAIHVSS